MGEDISALLLRDLAASVGPTMAAAAVRSHCEKLGFTENKLSKPQALELLEHIGRGLNVFIGKERATATIAAIRTKLEALS